MPRLLLMTGLALALNGCAYHRLVTKEPNPGDHIYHRVHSDAIGWGAFEQRRIADKCETNMLSEVRVRTSFAQGLATALTLGFWQPSTIEYRCSKRPTGEGEIQP